MKGLIIDASYHITDGQPYVCLFGRLENNEAFVTVNAFQPYFFIKEKDLKKALLIETIDYEKTSLKTFDEEKVVKILVDIPADVPKFRRFLETEGLKTYEADIVFPRRFLIDHKIQGGVLIEGEYGYEGMLCVYKEPELRPTSIGIIPKVMSVDIETNPTASKIYSIAIVCNKVETVLIISDKKLKHAESLPSEEALLERFFAVVHEIDPDIITGWNFLDFDMQVIRKRCKNLKVPFVLGRTEKEAKLIVREGFFESSKIITEGRQVIDALGWVRSTVKLGSYKLETVAQHYLKEGKIPLENKAMEVEQFFTEDPQKLVDYNLRDAQLVIKILEVSTVLSLYLQRSMLTGLMLDEVSGSIASLDSIYLKRLRDRGYVASSVGHNIKKESIKGGYVMESKPGIYENVWVYDFKSLYPSLMRTFNIDPLAFNKKGITAPNGATFAREKGIIPEILEELWEVREEYRKKGDEVGRHAIKIFMNAMFGVFANPACRYYSVDLANAITAFARQVIQKTAGWICEEGFEVIYSDTDSCFVLGGSNAETVGRKMQEKINEKVSDHIKKEYKVQSYLELEFKKVYDTFLMPRLRLGDKGAKKRYAGITKGKLEIVGLEAVRGDWTPLAKKFQEELLLRVFTGQRIEGFISSFVHDLRHGKYDHLLTYRKTLRKPLREYTKIIPPHVKVAKKVRQFKGNIVSYVYTMSGVEPVGSEKSPYDYDHYVQKQLKPIADSILVFLGLKFDKILSGQQSLCGY